VKRKIGIIIAWLVFSVTSFAEDGSEKLGDIDFKDISVVDAARVLSEVSSVNIIVSQEAESKRFSLFIRDTSIKDAIESICKITGLWYDYDREAKVFMIMTEEQYRKNITVYSNEKTKVFNLQHQNILMAVNSIEGIFGERVFVFEPEEDPSYLYEGDFSEESSSGSTSVTEINKTSNVVVNNTSTQIQGDKNNIDDVTVQQLADIRNMVNQTRIEQEKLNQLLSESQAPIRVTYNYNQNMVLVRSSDMDALEEIESLIKTIDVPTRQVLLEMKILQLTLGEDDKSVFEYGFDDGTTNFSINKNTDIDSATFLFSSLSNNISASIELLSQENKVKVLATPLIISANNREAELFIGEERTLVKGAEVSTTITDNIVYQTYTVKTEDRDIGNTLKIWPRINNDKTVTLDIEQESSSVLEDGQDVPVVVNDQIESMYTDLVTTATLDLTAIAKEGNTIAIGGLMRSERSETHRKIPLLGDIPGIGKIFRSDIESDANTEIVLLITPYIFDNFEDAQRAQVVLNQSNNPDRSAVIAEFKSRNQVRGELNKHEAQNAIRLSQAMANYKKSQTIESPFEIKAPQFRHWKLMNGLIIDATSTITDGYWYITSTRVRNNGQFAISLKPELFGSGWVGMLSQSTELAPGDQTEVSFISHKTPAAVLNTINADFMLTQHSMELE
jgi:type II secretory pathway component GspD/PulD (secretin)